MRVTRSLRRTGDVCTGRWATECGGTGWNQSFACFCSDWLIDIGTLYDRVCNYSRGRDGVVDEW